MPAQDRTLCSRGATPVNTPFFRILDPPMEVTVATTLAIGLAGGLLGGLMGLGGGVIMIPLLTVTSGSQPYLYQSASLLAAVAVSLGSIPRHVRSGLVNRPFVLRSLPCSIPTTIASALTAALLPNQHLLEVSFAIFLAVIGIGELGGFVRRTTGATDSSPIQNTWLRASAVGGCMGTLCGLLGVGGGVIALPMIRVLTGFDMRTTVATAAVLILPTVIVGGLMRLAAVQHTTSVDGQPMTAWAILSLALLLSPGCLIGGVLGATWAHRLRNSTLERAFGLLCLGLSAKMSGLF